MASKKTISLYRIKVIIIIIEANKKQVPLKSYFLKIRIDSVNQILRNKENILTRITNQKFPCVYSCLSNNK